LDKNTIIVVVLCVLVLIFWTRIAEMLGLVKPVQPNQETGVADTTAVAQPQPKPAHKDTVATPEASQPPAAIPVMDAADSLIPERTFTAITPNFVIRFSTHGGGIEYLALEKYKYQNGHEGEVVLVDDSDGVVPDFETAGGNYQAERLNFTTDESDFELGPGSDPRTVTFVHENGNGGRIIKTYTIYPDRYDIGFDLTIDDIESFGFERSYELVWGVTPAPTEPNVKDDYSYFKVVAMMDGLEEFDDFDNGIMKDQVIGMTTWAGLRTKYFAAIMIPRNVEPEGITATGKEFKIKVNDKEVEARRLTAALDMPISNYGSVSNSYSLYVGPIDYDRLDSYGIGLEQLTSLGWVIIKPFSIAIIWLLPKMYKIIPNYGIVVILFSLMVKLITYPLTRKQNLAMAKMKDLQPKMKDLQEKFKNDPQKLNKEMMKLYKEAGANPLSGCLPILPQMPLFFALFNVFKTTIEFRGASFFGWITDLSTPDPLYILPIIMVIVMFVQQKMTVTDPKQKMMVYIFPLFFGWISLNFPAGLVLYWTGFSLLSFLELMFIRKRQDSAVQVIEEKK